MRNKLNGSGTGPSSGKSARPRGCTRIRRFSRLPHSDTLFLQLHADALVDDAVEQREALLVAGRKRIRHGACIPGTLGRGRDGGDLGDLRLAQLAGQMTVLAGEANVIRQFLGIASGGDEIDGVGRELSGSGQAAANAAVIGVCFGEQHQ